MLPQDTIRPFAYLRSTKDVSDPLPGPLDGVKVCMLVTNDVSRDTRVRREARALMDAGARVTIVGVGDRDTTTEGYDIRLLKPPRSSTYPLRFVRIAVNVWRTFRFERTMSAAAAKLHADIYHCNDLDTLGAGARAATRVGGKLVYDSHELFLEHESVQRQWQLPLWARAESKWCSRADLVLTVNDLIAEDLAAHYQVPRPLVILNGPIACSDPSPVMSPLRVFFQGSYTHGRVLPELIEAMDRVHDVVHLTLQGYGPLEDDLRAAVSDRGLETSVTFVPPCGPEDTARSAEGYDVGVVGAEGSCESYRLQSPNKLFSYLGGGLALLVPDLPVMRGIVEEHDCGMIIDEMTPEALADALRLLAEHPEDVARMKAGAARACTEFLWSHQADKLVGAYEMLVGSKGFLS